MNFLPGSEALYNTQLRRMYASSSPLSELTLHRLDSWCMRQVVRTLQTDHLEQISFLEHIILHLAQSVVSLRRNSSFQLIFAWLPGGGTGREADQLHSPALGCMTLHQQPYTRRSAAAPCCRSSCQSLHWSSVCCDSGPRLQEPNRVRCCVLSVQLQQV